jgi:galactonate dehydratase
MKITRISTLVVNARMRNWIFVKVETDQPGLYGWGEATLEWKTKGVTGAVEDLAVLLIGAAPNTSGRSCTASTFGAAASPTTPP